MVAHSGGYDCSDRTRVLDVKLQNYAVPMPREFCRQHVGKVYTLAEIKKLVDGLSAQMNNVLICGGWGCRHVWAATTMRQERAAA